MLIMHLFNNHYVQMITDKLGNMSHKESFMTPLGYLQRLALFVNVGSLGADGEDSTTTGGNASICKSMKQIKVKNKEEYI